MIRLLVPHPESPPKARRRAARCAAAVALALAALSAPHGARADGQAQPDPAKLRLAAESFDQGAAALQRKEHELAASHFEAAYDAVPTPKALRLAMRSRLEAGQGSRAATLAAIGLDRYPSDAETVKLANETLEKLGPLVHRVSIACASPCVIAVGTRAVPGQPTTRWTVYLDPGRETIAASFFGKKAVRRELDVSAGGSTEIRFELDEAHEAGVGVGAGVAAVARAEAAGEGRGAGAARAGAGAAARADEAKPAPAPSRSGLSPWVFVGGLVATAGVGGVTIWSAVDTETNPGPDAVRELCKGQGESCPVFQDALAQQTRTNILIGATAGTAALTVLVGVFFTDWGGSPKPASASARPFVSASARGALVGANGSF